jgi:hypothetical protein
VKFWVGVCGYFFPLILIFMEAVFKADSNPDWSFAAPALGATSVAILISSLRAVSPRKEEILGGDYAATLASETDFIHVLTFLTFGAVALWGWIISEASSPAPPELIWGVSRPLALSVAAYVVAQTMVSWKEHKYA